jgi:hypothetical protein
MHYFAKIIDGEEFGGMGWNIDRWNVLDSKDGVITLKVNKKK